jgi:hypothetical protein
MGGLIIAVRPKYIAPHWLVTAIWYLATSALFTNITILIEWIYGPEFELSYTNIGVFGEAMINITMTAVVLGIFKELVRLRRRAAKAEAELAVDAANDAVLEKLLK